MNIHPGRLRGPGATDPPTAQPALRFIVPTRSQKVTPTQEPTGTVRSGPLRSRDYETFNGTIYEHLTAEERATLMVMWADGAASAPLLAALVAVRPPLADIVLQVLADRQTRSSLQ